VITGLGIILLPICLFYWRTPARLLELAFVGSAFAAAAVIVMGGYGVSPGLVPTALFIGFFALKTVFGTRYPGERIALRVLLPFIIAVIGGLASSVLLPRFFAGVIFVWPQKMSGFGVIAPLMPNAGNITQDLYLILNAALTITAAIYLTRPGFDLYRLLNAYLLSGLLVVAISLWQFLGNIAGIWFPTDFFLSNPGWALLSDETVGGLVRLTGPFSEPAALAQYLCGSVCAAGWMILNGSRARLPRLLLASGLIVIILSTSTTGYAALLILSAILIAYTLFAGSPRLRRRVAAGVTGALALAGAAAVTVPAIAPGVARQAVVITEATFTKQSSSSYTDRVTADRDSMHELVESYGLGVGWGSNRSSSLIPGLCAALGGWGILLLLWFAISIAGHVRVAQRAATSTAPRMVMHGCAGGILGTLTAAVLSAPAITSPDFFLLLALLIGAAARVRCEALAAGRSTAPQASFVGRRTFDISSLRIG
jgi:hypothetical protein